MRAIGFIWIVSVWLLVGADAARADLSGTWSGKLQCFIARGHLAQPEVSRQTERDFSIAIAMDDLVGHLETGEVSGVRSRFLACDHGGTYKFIGDGRRGAFQYLGDPAGGGCSASITQAGFGLVKQGSRPRLVLEYSETRNDGAPSVANCRATLKREPGNP